MLLDPKIGNRARIKRGSGPPKSLSIPHVVERAVRNGERQPRKRSGQGKSAATEQLPLRQLPKELEKRERASRRKSRDTPTPLTGPRPRRGSALADESPETLPPLSLDRDPAGGEEAPGTKHQVHPEAPPPAHLKGGKEKRKKSQAQGSHLEVLAGQLPSPSLKLPPTSPKPQEVTAAVFPLFLPKFKCNNMYFSITFSYALHTFFFFL